MLAVAFRTSPRTSKRPWKFSNPNIVDQFVTIYLANFSATVKLRAEKFCFCGRKEISRRFSSESQAGSGQRWRVLMNSLIRVTSVNIHTLCGCSCSTQSCTPAIVVRKPINHLGISFRVSLNSPARDMEINYLQNRIQRRYANRDSFRGNSFDSPVVESAKKKLSLIRRHTKCEEIEEIL